jgi:transposase
MARNGEKKTQKQKSLPFIEPDAAGIDIGATEIYVAVPEERDKRSVRKFATFTEELHRLADWLIACSIKTVAIESTGVYWIALFQILERRSLEVCLVNARHVKGVPGRKTDIQDCQWLQYLHSVGLLRGSFRPAEAVCAVRSILRHRDTLLKGASRQVVLMQKALTHGFMPGSHACGQRCTGRIGGRASPGDGIGPGMLSFSGSIPRKCRRLRRIGV